MDEGILRVLIVSLGMTLVAIVVLVIGSLIRRGKEPGMGVELAFITLIGILVFLWLDRGVGFVWRPLPHVSKGLIGSKLEVLWRSGDGFPSPSQGSPEKEPEAPDAPVSGASSYMAAMAAQLTAKCGGAQAAMVAPFLLLSCSRQREDGMLQGRGSHEIGLPGGAILIQLLRRFIDRRLLPREQVLALLGDAADELEWDAEQATDMHLMAADIIRKELVPMV